jgi:hypothetical protein
MMLMAVRIIAVAVAVLGLVDPAVVINRAPAVPVSLRIVEASPLDGGRAGGGTWRGRAEAIRNRLIEKLASVADISGERPPRAVVLIGSVVPAALPAEGVPVSTVSLFADVPPNVRLVWIEEPRPAALRQAITTVAEFEGVGFRGRTTVFTLSDRGVAVATVEHRWTKDRERFRARLRYAPPSAGLHVVTVGAQPLGGETTADDNAADAALLVDARPLRVLAYEPRPSWNATFVRRALEADPRFELASLVRSSRGILVRSGAAPSDLLARALDEFDVVLVGAPEELRAAELDALSRFASQRGGGVVFLPDRRPSGPYEGILPPGRFEEALVEIPGALLAEHSNDMRASEFLVTHGTPVAVEIVAAIERSGTRAPVSTTWTHGAGRMLLWGALDAWRFRAEADGAFVRFWQAATADLAVAAPQRIDVSLSPRVAAVDEPVTVRATVRATEFAGEGDRIAIPPVGATLVSTAGAEQPVRLWPTAEAGAFEGTAAAPETGSYEVRVTAGRHVGRASMDVTLAPRRAIMEDAEAMALVARSTGGVAVRADDLRPLEDHLRALAAPPELITVRPLRSVWWVALFATCLSAEWAVRRRRGLR